LKTIVILLSLVIIGTDLGRRRERRRGSERERGEREREREVKRANMHLWFTAHGPLYAPWVPNYILSTHPRKVEHTAVGCSLCVHTNSYGIQLVFLNGQTHYH
jgi:hypothetical protein